MTLILNITEGVINLGMKPIMRKGVRILRPSEYKLLQQTIPKQHHKTALATLLFTGMRYVEAMRLQDNRDWFDGDFINLPKIAMGKKKQKQPERSIRLNPLGKQIIPYFLDATAKLPVWQTWKENMKRWGEKAGIGNNGLGVRTTRKTWESWLVTYYPNNFVQITLSQGHDTNTAIRHYLGLNFSDVEVLGMKEFVEGWI